MIHTKTMKSPIGTLTLVASDKGLRSISFENGKRKAKDTSESNHSILRQTEKELNEYFLGKRSEFTVPLEMEGTEFQKKVWSALVKIPYGETVSYKKQAERIGNPRGVRAVASANGRNPIPIIVPCHRVIATTGHLHGYAGGLPIKQKLLEVEGLRIKHQKISS